MLRIGRGLGAISTATLWIAGTGVVVMTVIVAYQVFSRFVLNYSPNWTEALALMLMSWFIFLGSAVGVRENYHLGFDVLLYILPKGSKNALRLISDIVVAVFGVGMVWYGGQLCILTWPSTIPALGLPGGFDYLPIIAGGVLFTLFALERIALRFAGVEIDKDVSLEDVPDADSVKEF